MAAWLRMGSSVHRLDNSDIKYELAKAGGPEMHTTMGALIDSMTVMADTQVLFEAFEHHNGERISMGKATKEADGEYHAVVWLREEGLFWECYSNHGRHLETRPPVEKTETSHPDLTASR